MNGTVARATVTSTGAQRFPSAAVSAAQVVSQARSENFTVAPFFLRRAQRRHLEAVYGFARFVDDLGDEAGDDSSPDDSALDGARRDRLARLAWAEHELERAAAGTASHEIFERVGTTIRASALDLAPFRDLIEANRRDQEVTSYATFDDLVGYCRLSADPVGRIVLAIFGVSSPERAAWSDDVCTALQVVEHCQDVGEDARRGRVYLPADDLARLSCSVDDLRAASTSPALAAVVRCQVARARDLLCSAVPLVASLTGRARLLVAGFAAGGIAAADAIESHGYDVLASSCKASNAAVARAACRLLARGRRRSSKQRHGGGGIEGGA